MTKRHKVHTKITKNLIIYQVQSYQFELKHSISSLIVWSCLGFEPLLGGELQSFLLELLEIVHDDFEVGEDDGEFGEICDVLNDDASQLFQLVFWFSDCCAHFGVFSSLSHNLFLKKIGNYWVIES